MKRAIVTRVFIKDPGEIKMFQVKLPRDTEQVIGIETGLQWIWEVPPNDPPIPSNWTPFTMARNLVVAEMKMQTSDKSNIFYASEVCFSRNEGFGDFTSPNWRASVYTHGQQSLEDVVKLGGNETLLCGIVRDKVKEVYAGNYGYLVKVVVWIKEFEKGKSA